MLNCQLQMTLEMSSNCANRNTVHDETSDPQSAEFLYTQTVFQTVTVIIQVWVTVALQFRPSLPRNATLCAFANIINVLISTFFLLIKKVREIKNVKKRI
jgi:hypothetical protein